MRYLREVRHLTRLVAVAEPSAANPSGRRLGVALSLRIVRDPTAIRKEAANIRLLRQTHVSCLCSVNGEPRPEMAMHLPGTVRILSPWVTVLKFSYIEETLWMFLESTSSGN